MKDFHTVKGVVKILSPMVDVTAESAIYNRLSTFLGEYLPDKTFGLLLIELLLNVIAIDIFIQDMTRNLKDSPFYKLLDISATPGDRSYTIVIRYSPIITELGVPVVQDEVLYAQYSLSTRGNDRFIVYDRSPHGYSS